MALSKTIELYNGVNVSYHRIASVLIETNKFNLIKVYSYLSAYRRQKQKEQTESDEIVDAFQTTYIYKKDYTTPYDQTMTIESAYEWLKKNIDEFKDATDVLEDESTATSE